MAHRDILVEFFARYPSALGATHVGGQYRLICPECGDMIAVAVAADDICSIDVVCLNCGYEDHLTDSTDARDAPPAARTVAHAVPSHHAAAAHAD